MLLEKLRIEIVKYGLDMLNSGLTEGTGGNLSLFDPESKLVAIKPSSIPYDKITPEDVVVVDLNGKVVEGKLKPSSETPMHTYIFRHRPTVTAIMHTHAPFSTVMCVINKDLPIVTQDLAFFAEDKVCVAPFQLPGSEKLGEVAETYLGSSNVVFLQNHGTLAIGTSMQMAFSATWALERAAMAYIYSLAAGGDCTVIPADAAQKMRSHIKPASN
jgi:L-ribulose-5-phosphate 4-epimerase